MGFIMRWIAGTMFFLVALWPYVAMIGGTQRPERVDGPSETLIVISPHRREVRQEYSRGFSEWMRERYGRAVEIRWLDVGGTSKILKDLESRFAAAPDAPGVDLLFGGGVAPYLTAAAEGWLAPVTLPPDVLAEIPSHCAGAPVYDPHGLWHGVALSGFGILYNRPVIERLGLPVPRDWEDLGRPAFRTWVASGDPRSSGSVHMCYEIILQAYGFDAGWNIITRLCANVRHFGEAGGTAPREVAAGEAAAGMVIDQYARTVVESVAGDRLVFVLPDRHTVIGPDAIGLIRGAPHAEPAKWFVEYALRAEGQRILFQAAGAGGQRASLHRLPVRRASYDEPGAPRPNPYELTQGFRYDDAKGMRRWNVLNDLMGVWLIDAHADLSAAWAQVIDRGVNTAEVEALCAPPVSEAELEALAEQWRDPRRRFAVMRAWAEEARKRYRRLRGD